MSKNFGGRNLCQGQIFLNQKLIETNKNWDQQFSDQNIFGPVFFNKIIFAKKDNNICLLKNKGEQGLETVFLFASHKHRKFLDFFFLFFFLPTFL